MYYIYKEYCITYNIIMNAHPHFSSPFYDIFSMLASLPSLLTFLYSSLHEVLPPPPYLNKGGMEICRVNGKIP